MFLRARTRRKDGKQHRYWSVVENRRGRGVRVGAMRLRRPRQFGACWLALELWTMLGLDNFWQSRLPASRKGTRWASVFAALVAYRLTDLGSEWRLHRQWFHGSALGDLLGEDFAPAQKDKLYRCLDLLAAHREALFVHLPQRWGELFEAPNALLPALGAAKKQAGRAWRLVRLRLPGAGEAVTPTTFGYQLDRAKLRQAIRRAGRYLPRSNMPAAAPELVWENYLLPTRIEQAFKELKSDLAIRPMYHQLDKRIEAHIFVSFLAYCLHATLTNLARRHAAGLTVRAILEKLSTIVMIDVHLPATDGLAILLSRYTEPDAEVELLLSQLDLRLPSQPPTQIYDLQPESL